MNRATFLLLLALTIAFVSVCTGHAQTAPGATPNKVFAAPTPAPKPRPAVTPKSPLNSGNVAGQKSPGPEKTQLIAVYHGSGFFDEALAQKVRPALVKSLHLESDAQPGSTAENRQVPGNPINPAADMLDAAAALAKRITQ